MLPAELPLRYRPLLPCTLFGHAYDCKTTIDVSSLPGLGLPCSRLLDSWPGRRLQMPEPGKNRPQALAGMLR